MTIYRGIGGSGDSATGEDVFGDNSSITSLNGISGAIQTPTYIKFASDANHTANQGELTWNTAEGTLDLGLNHGGVVLQIGQELHYRVTNQSGSNIPDGTLVAFVGTTGNSGKLLIDVYDGTQASKAILGLTTETIVNGTNGYVTSFGKVRGIQTNGANYGETWVDGDILYPSPSGLTKVLPQAPAAKQPVAVVVNAHNSNGELFVRVQSGTTLGEDELVQLASLTDGDVLQYDGAQARFENRSLSAAGILPTSAIGTTVQAYDSNLTSFVSTFTLPTTDSTNGYVLTTNGAGTLSFSAGGGGLADGDKGDITVSSGGTVWTVDNDAITYAKIQNVSATDKLLGRSSVGAGDIEEISCTQAGRNLLDDVDAAAQRTTLGLGTLATQSGTFSGTSSGTNTGDQNIFQTVAVSGQSNVVADTTTDTLTLVAGTNLTITTDASTDSVTFNASAYPLTSDTAKSATSTAVDFTGLPSWTKRISILFNAVSTNGTSVVQVQLGSTTFTTSGYSAGASLLTGTSGNTASYTSGFGTYANAAADTRSGQMVLTNISGNTWICSGIFNISGGTNTIHFSGVVTLAGVLDRVRITTVNGTDTFDAGTINILYE